MNFVQLEQRWERQSIRGGVKFWYGISRESASMTVLFSTSHIFIMHRIFHLLLLHQSQSQYECHIHYAVSQTIVTLHIHWTEEKKMHMVYCLTCGCSSLGGSSCSTNHFLAGRNAPQENHRQFTKKMLARVLLSFTSIWFFIYLIIN